MESKEFQKQRNICTKYKPYAKKSTSGITLIALVVTIIVLLILAGISINLILGDNGIITKASLAKEAQEMAQLKEEAELIKATGLAENLSKVDGEYGKADLLEDLNNNFEGSTLGSDRITTSDGKYDIIVDDDLNITVEKNGEADNIKVGRIIITSNVVQEDTDTYIELYFEIEGKKNTTEFLADYLNTNIYPDINDSTELENIINPERFNDEVRESFQKQADDIGISYSEFLKYYIYMTQIQEEVANNDNAVEQTFGIINDSKLKYSYCCYYLGEEEYTLAEDIEQQALRIFNIEGTFDEAAASIGTSKAQLQQQAEAVGVTYEQYLRYMIASECDEMYKINVTVSNGQTAAVSLEEAFWSFIITEPGEYIITAEMIDGRKGKTTVVVEESEVLDPDGWEVAWTCTDGTTWSNQITNDGTTELPSEGVIAKFYNTGNTITPQLPEILGGVTLDSGAEYKLIFEGSGNMGSLDIDEGYKAWLNTQYGCYVSEVIISNGITNIADSAFDTFISLETIEIPETVENIGKGAFALCYKLTSSITIPEKMTSVAENTFCGCSSITEITIPDSITSIEEGAFSLCSALTNISIPENVTSIGVKAFQDCTSLTNISIPKNVTFIGGGAFSGTGITEITIPDGITEISSGIFADCANLTSVTIPSSVTTIGDNAFSECTKLTSIVIPDTVEFIGGSAFEECSALERITLSTKITSIEQSLFENCTKLKTITIPSNVTTIGAWAFSGCTALETIIIPDSVTYLDQQAFENCSTLTSITIPSKVSYIGNSAFENCSNLKSVTILYSTYTITLGNNVFMGLPANSYIYVSNSTIQAKFKDGTHYDSTKTTISIK